MKTFGEILKSLRKSKGITQEQLGDMFNITKTGVSYWENGKSTPSYEMLIELADYFDVDVNTLIGYSEDSEVYSASNIEYISVPLYSPICCGNGGFNDDEILDYVAVPKSGLSRASEYFAQYAKGESMKDAGINNGDLLIFEKTQRVASGTIGCFCIDDNEAVCKKYMESKGTVILQPMNNTYEPIVIDPSNTCFRCIGKLKKSIKSY